jgi:diadenosine tetraphosphate (Ap4A) HIT family hydrolase
MFQLHPQLLQDTYKIGDLDLCELLLHKDSQFPWCILVPKRDDIVEICQLELVDRQGLMEESCRLTEVMMDLFHPRKMNIAALGNLVPQLHLHHVARYEDDCAWPHPIWGRSPFQAYKHDVLCERIQRLQYAFAGEGFTSVTLPTV